MNRYSVDTHWTTVSLCIGHLLDNKCDRLYEELTLLWVKAEVEIHRTGSYFCFATNHILSFKFLLILICRSFAVILTYVINMDACVH